MDNQTAFVVFHKSSGEWQLQLSCDIGINNVMIHVVYDCIYSNAESSLSMLRYERGGEGRDR